MAENLITRLMDHNYRSNIHVDAQFFDAGRGGEGETCCEQMKPRLWRWQIIIEEELTDQSPQLHSRYQVLRYHESSY